MNVSASNAERPSLDLEGLNLPELLDQLEDVVLPAPPSLMPETFGWVVLGVLLLGLIATALVLVFRRRQATAYRRAALAELAAIEARIDDPSQTPEQIAAIATLIRRTALAVFPRAEVAHLYGDEWKAFLTRTSPRPLAGDLDALVIGPYRVGRPGDGVDAGGAARAARRWIEQHRA